MDGWESEFWDEIQHSEEEDSHYLSLDSDFYLIIILLHDILRILHDHLIAAGLWKLPWPLIIGVQGHSCAFKLSCEDELEQEQGTMLVCVPGDAGVLRSCELMVESLWR